MSDIPTILRKLVINAAQFYTPKIKRSDVNLEMFFTVNGSNADDILELLSSCSDGHWYKVTIEPIPEDEG